jgi:hypothetical protein
MSETGGEGEAEDSGGAGAREPSLEGLSVRPSKHRGMQLRRDGKRKLFKGKARKVFLEWVAATGNVVFSAAKAGFVYQTVWKNRLKDAEFADEMDRALDQGIVRAKARLIEDKIKGRIEVDGDLDEVELEPADPAVVLTLVREHERARAGVRKAGRAPRVATNAEVEAALRKRLRVFVKRERAMRRVLRDGSSTSSAPPQDERGSGGRGGVSGRSGSDGGAATPPPSGWFPSPSSDGEALE